MLRFKAQSLRRPSGIQIYTYVVVLHVLCSFIAALSGNDPYEVKHEASLRIGKIEEEWEEKIRQSAGYHIPASWNVMPGKESSNMKNEDASAEIELTGKEDDLPRMLAAISPWNVSSVSLKSA